jgi:LPXTG-site transpeptidase (sortase) family protein
MASHSISAAKTTPAQPAAPPQPSLRARVSWTLGNLLLLTGAYLLLFVGGLYSEAEYYRMAARGDNDLPAPRIYSMDVPSQTSGSSAAMPAFEVPVLSGGTSGEQITSGIPAESEAEFASTIERIMIPSIDVDSKVIEVGWKIEVQNGREVALWQVAEYGVGHHKNSANPGEGENIVLAGHVGGFGKVFRDLYYVEPGDQVILYSEGQQYLYMIQDHLMLQESGVSAEQRAANARYIEPMGEEMVTLVTCWPASGRDRYTQRIIIRAMPYGTANNEVLVRSPGTWTVR